MKRHFTAVLSILALTPISLWTGCTGCEPVQTNEDAAVVSPDGAQSDGGASDLLAPDSGQDSAQPDAHVGDTTGVDTTGADSYADDAVAYDTPGNDTDDPGDAAVTDGNLRLDAAVTDAPVGDLTATADATVADAPHADSAATGDAFAPDARQVDAEVPDATTANDAQPGFLQLENWTLPEGGSIEANFWRPSYEYGGNSSNLGYHSWALLDMNGDGQPDLVEYHELIAYESFNWAKRPFGFPDNMHWRVFLNTGQGFAQEALQWMLPPGGAQIAGYWNTAYEYDGSPSNLGQHAWVLQDMDGDLRPDLVEYHEITDYDGASWTKRPFGFPDNNHWRVYLNNGSGFDATPVVWSLPPGGDLEASYWRTGYEYDGSASNLGQHGWTLLDINGDLQPDLVEYQEITDYNGLSWAKRPFGFPDNSHWQVYLNTGSGFSSTVARWGLPPGGDLEASYWRTGYEYDGSVSNLGQQSWQLQDMDGDRRPDLLVYHEITDDEGFSWAKRPFGFPDDSHWRVYINSGTAFADTATLWRLPNGGSLDASYFKTAYEFGGSTTNLGQPAWILRDMDGDGRPNLVEYHEITDYNGLSWAKLPFGYPQNSHWKVYTNSGDSFVQVATDWQLPTGGGIDASYWRTAYEYDGALSNLGEQAWQIEDMNGDGITDILVYHEIMSTDGSWGKRTFGFPDTSQWRVYLGAAR